MSETGSSTRRRVKLYMLNEDRQWDDKGTGYVSSVFVESLNGIALLVVSEADGSSLLESNIQSDTAYQKQQETLIVWSEAESVDLALSFQEKEGCEEIWGKICSVQGKDPSVEITQEVVDEAETEECDDTESESGSACSLAVSDNTSLDLPPCELGRLEDLAELVTAPGLAKRGLASALQRQGYLRRLCTELFHTAEDLDDRDSLHHLNDIVRGVFLMNQKFLLDILLDPEVIVDVIGILEYDSSKPVKANHREFLKSQSHYREPLQFHNAALREKIQQTYRMQYIQECILPTPSLFDDNQFPELTSLILINKMNVLNAVIDDDKLMVNLFASLCDSQESNERRLELALFFKELCGFSTALETTFWKPKKNVFYNSLIKHQALDAMASLFATNCTKIRTVVTDILLAFVDNSPGLVRDHLVKEIGPDSRLLINIIIQQMFSDSDPEMGDALRLVGLLRVLVDPESMVGSQAAPNVVYPHNATEFLRFFYHHAMPNLLEPLFANTSGPSPAKDDYRTAQLLYYIVDLLTFCIEQHTYHVKNLVLAKDLIRHVLVLLRSKHSFLVLGVLRLFRRLVGLKDDFYENYLVKYSLFRPIVELFVRNGSRYNLINSSIIELFEFVYTESIRLLIFHVVENYWEALKDVNYVSTFRSINIRYEQLKDKARDSRRASSSPAMVNSYGLALQSIALYNRPMDAYRRDPRAPDEEEEAWFDQEEEEQAPPLYLQSPTKIVDKESATTEASDESEVKLSKVEGMSEKSVCLPDISCASDASHMPEAIPAVGVPQKAETSLEPGASHMQNAPLVNDALCVPNALYLEDSSRVTEVSNAPEVASMVPSAADAKVVPGVAILADVAAAAEIERSKIVEVSAPSAEVPDVGESEAPDSDDCVPTKRARIDELQADQSATEPTASLPPIESYATCQQTE